MGTRPKKVKLFKRVRVDYVAYCPHCGVAMCSKKEPSMIVRCNFCGEDFMPVEDNH